MEQPKQNNLRISCNDPNADTKYIFYITENEIFIVNRTNEAFVLKINRKEYKSCFIPNSVFQKHQSEKPTKPLNIFAVFGVIEIAEIRFLVAVSKAQIIGSIGASDIMKIESVKFLTISREQYKNFDYETCYDKLERIKEFLKTGFYFSYTYKLHFQFSGKTALTTKEMTLDFGKNHFIWNYKSIKQFLPLKDSKKKGNIDATNVEKTDFFDLGMTTLAQSQEHDDFANQFFIPFIQGYVAILEEADIKFVLISRRSYLMGGTRYNNRGIDNTGHVANYVETEQLVFHREKIYRFFQIRGSLPFYWEQVKGIINPRVDIHQRIDVNLEVISKHINLVMDKKFKKLVFFNLLSRKISDEELLSKYLVDLLESLSKNDAFKNKLLYEHVDFHQITKPTDFSSVDKYIYNIFNSGSVNSEIGFDEFEYSDLLDIFNLKLSQQTLIRTNCLDCLDRTNATQTKIGHYAFYKILERTQSKVLANFKPEDRINPLSFFERSNMPFFEKMRKVWANNGDIISIIYAGTGATTSSVTRKGEKSSITSFLDHKLKSVTRFYLNNFDDNFKQEIIDVLLHKKTQSIRQSTLYMSNTEMPKVEEVTIHLITLITSNNNQNLVIGKKTISRIFDNRNPSDLILILTRNDKERTVQLYSESYIVCNSFSELFHLLTKQLNGFKLIEESSEAKFNCMLFAHKDQISRVAYTKSDKISFNNIFQNVGLRTSHIIEHTGIEIFALKVEKGAFNYSLSKMVEKIFEKYIDKEYDIVFIIAHVENFELDKFNISGNYIKIAEEIRVNSSNSKYTSVLMAFSSKMLIEQGFKPEYNSILWDDNEISTELCVNASTFHLKKIG